MLDKHKKDITFCAFCPKLCGFSCPVAQVTASETYTPTGKMNLLYLFMSGNLQLSEELSDIIFNGCSSCLSCKNYCKWEIEIPEIIKTAKEMFIKNNIIPENVSSVLKNLYNFKNPYGKDIQAKLKEIIPDKYFKNREKILYFPGCKTIEYFPENITNTIKFFEKFDIEFSMLDETTCCGILNLNLGDTEGFKNLQNENKRKFYGTKTIVCSCPECAYAFKEKYKIKDVLSISEFVWSTCLRNGVYSSKETISVMYSDPCYLSRYLQVVDAPRDILSQICQVKVVEFLWCKERGRCCGGILNFIKPSLSDKIARQKIEEAKEKNQTTIITSCPQCQYILSKAPDNLKIKDILSFTMERIS